MCLWCNESGKRFETKEDVQRHMVGLFSPEIQIICAAQVGKGHCKLLHDGETLIEYDDW